MIRRALAAAVRGGDHEEAVAGLHDGHDGLGVAVGHSLGERARALARGEGEAADGGALDLVPLLFQIPADELADFGSDVFAHEPSCSRPVSPRKHYTPRFTCV